MAARLPALALFAALVAAPVLAPPDADPATTLGSPDPGQTPDRYWCASEDCPDGDVGVRQLALAGAQVEADEEGVLVSARAFARRSSGTAPRPDRAAAPGDRHHGAHRGNGTAGGDLADGGARLRRRSSHRGRARRHVRSFGPQCAPCGQSGGTGAEILLDATVEPDFDGDLLGDDTQDPDGGGKGLDDLGSDGFFDEEFDDEFGDENGEGEPADKRRKRLRLIRATARRGGGVKLVLAVPRRGVLSAVAKAPATVAAARTRVRKAGRVRLALSPSRKGRELLERRDRVRARVTITLDPRRGPVRSLTTRVWLERSKPPRG